LKPHYSFYIPSKGRAGKSSTVELLRYEGLDFRIAVEPQDWESYCEAYGEEFLLKLDRNNGNLFYARNFIKQYSIEQSEPFHWQLDDDMRTFKRRKGNKNIKISARLLFGEVEELVDNYQNIGLAGPSHSIFAFAKRKMYSVNRQVSGCFLINNAIDIWYRPNLPEDTDYSMQVLTSEGGKWCTILFNRLLFDTPPAAQFAGGLTEIGWKGKQRQIAAANLMQTWPGCFKIKRVKSKYEPEGKVRVLPSKIWGTFSQRPILK